MFRRYDSAPYIIHAFREIPKRTLNTEGGVCGQFCDAPSSCRKVYNGLGQLALLTTPGAKPGLDETQVVFGEGFAVVAGMLSFANLTKGDAARSN